jgi:hypothetical protein
MSEDHPIIGILHNNWKNWRKKEMREEKEKSDRKMMSLEQIVRNQVAVTHLMDMVENLEQMKGVVVTSDDALIENQILAIIHLIKTLEEKIANVTLPEWDKWLQAEKEGKVG